MAKPSGRDIKTEVLDEARLAIQRGGVNGFSYGTIAQAIGVRAPSIHHHFRHKDDLVADATSRYRIAFNERVDAIDAATAEDCLVAYADMFAATAADELMCLCGAVAASWDDVDDHTRAEVDGFFDDQVRWLTGELTRGVRDGHFRADLDVEDAAETLLAALEGEMLLARAGRPSRQGVMRRMLPLLTI